MLNFQISQKGTFRSILSGASVLLLAKGKDLVTTCHILFKNP